jgi:hypothetical protein
MRPMTRFREKIRKQETGSDGLALFSQCRFCLFLAMPDLVVSCDAGFVFRFSLWARCG